MSEALSLVDFVVGVNSTALNCGVGRAKKKVRQRPELSMEVFDSTMDGNGFIEKKMALSVMIKLLGRKIAFNTLLNKVSILWNIRGQFQLMDLESDFDLVRFQDKDDLDNVLLGGPYVVFGHYLSVRT
ncbi:hypothetical protein PVK06_010659 [Gossypium arboreum]|uniref:DUF4283 domain-containing protein n=1 Tax=Gossypium arboreum TaxID=29729 RepID=A0ABR0Q7D6_GOSAR|nr:hypothetical protein PVK06_010659 [Gossypium arboreum]